jgi:hypothetical protein
LAAIPHRQLWAEVNRQDNSTVITLGGTTKKGKIGFAKQIAKLSEKLQKVSQV